MSRYVIGVDGGGTEAIAVLANQEGQILGHQKGGTSNYQVLGGEKLKAELEGLFDRLLHTSGFAQNKIDHIYMGLAGVGRQSDRVAVQKLFSNLKFAQAVTIDSDASVALAGAFGEDPGIILISGTGAICFGKTADGTMVRSGGWGYLLGDEGSGYYIGQRALMAALQDLDGRGEKTQLRPSLESRFNVPTIDEVIPLVYQGKLDRAQIAGLAPLVFEVAQQGDPVAEQIVRDTGKELGKLAKAVAHKLNLEHGKIQVALIGGVFKQKQMLITEISKELYEISWDVEITTPRFPPAIGAVILALKKIGIKMNETILENLSRSEFLFEKG